jgi:hypothetical protein
VDRGAEVSPSFRYGENIDMSAAEGFVVPAGGGKRFDSPTPGRSFAMKLLGRETNESIMMFEETLPAGPQASSICTATATRSPGCL